ncbi:hypothetical protein LINPERHAP2_LOCUS37063 [Linum perenne]
MALHCYSSSVLFFFTCCCFLILLFLSTGMTIGGEGHVVSGSAADAKTNWKKCYDDCQKGCPGFGSIPECNEGCAVKCAPNGGHAHSKLIDWLVLLFGLVFVSLQILYCGMLSSII